MSSDGGVHELQEIMDSKTFDNGSGSGGLQTPEEKNQRDLSDNIQLARIGKKAVLKRNFQSMAILGFSCTVLVTWEGSTVTFAQALENGGPSGVVYSFIITWIGNISVFSCLSELVSMAPTSGGQYHWVSMLAPRWCSKFLSYLTGWLCIAGWQGSSASTLYLNGSLITGMINLVNPNYQQKPYQTVLCAFALVGWSVIMNVMGGSVLPKFEGMILVLHIVGLFAVLVPLVVLSDHTSAAGVFNSFSNGGAFPSIGLSFLVGMIGNVFAFAGADAAYHMVEETHNAAVIVPRAVMFTMLINGVGGFAMVLALLFCIGDPAKAAAATTGYPFTYIFTQGTGSVAGATVMTALIMVLGACASVGFFASTSRVTWSFARDRAVPFWKTLSQVDERTKLPIYSVAATATITGLLNLIALGSTAAFNNIVGVGVSGLYSSYIIAASLLLYRRCTSGFKMPSMNEALPALANTTGAELVWGPWHIPGIWGILNNIFALCYLFVVWFFTFWPGAYHVSVQTMNYSSVVLSGVTFFSIVYYLIWGRHQYNGPIIEVEASQ